MADRDDALTDEERRLLDDLELQLHREAPDLCAVLGSRHAPAARPGPWVALAIGGLFIVLAGLLQGSGVAAFGGIIPVLVGVERATAVPSVRIAGRRVARLLTFGGWR